MAENDARILRAAGARVGILTRAELRAIGCSDQQIDRRIGDGRLVRIHPATFAVASASMSWAAHVRAAVAAAGPHAAASHRTAARLWDLDGARGSVIELIVPRGVRRQVAGAKVHETLDFDQRDLTERGGIVVTTVERTLIDVAWPAPYFRLEQMVDDAVRQGLSTYGVVLRRFLALARQGRPGVVKMRALLDARAEVYFPLWNYFERLVLQIIHRAGIEEPVLQHPVELAGDPYSLDLAWIGPRLVVECDGWDTHSTPRLLRRRAVLDGLGPASFVGDPRRCLGARPQVRPRSSAFFGPRTLRRLAEWPRR